MALFTFSSLLLSFSILFLAFAVWFNSTDFKPKEYHLPPPPVLDGPLAVNKPKKLEKLLEGKIMGPESIVVEKDTLYTCTKDGKCMKIVNGQIQKSIPLTGQKNCNGEPHMIPHCGRPLGIRRMNANQFIVADAIFGLFVIDFEKGIQDLLVPSFTTVAGKRLGFPDDLDIADNDTVFFSDLSSNYGYNDVFLAFLEHAQDGRLIEYKMSTGQMRVLVDGLVGANGVQVHPDKQSIIVCETAMARCHRYFFAGPKKGRQQIFVDNLPGFPDNIRLSASRTSFYMALYSHRSEKIPHLFDKLGPWPSARKFLGQLIKNLPVPWTKMLSPMSKYGIVLELDLNGKIIRSWHDPEGAVITDISEVVDDGGANLYLASFENNYIGRMSKN